MNRARARCSGILVFASVLFALAPSQVQARDIFVDGDLGSATCETYDPATGSCSGGANAAFQSLSAAAGAAEAGDVVLLRAGTYEEVLEPPRSGTAAAPIVFRAYESEAPLISGLDEPAIQLIGVSYVEIEGIFVRDVL